MTLKSEADERSADNNKIFYNLFYNGNTDTNEDGNSIVKGDGEESGVDTFKVKIGVIAAAGFESISNHALKVVLHPTDKDPLNNLMRNRKIASATSGFGATRVGDGKLFGVDGARPIHDGVFASIKLDLSKLATVVNDTTDYRQRNTPPSSRRSRLTPTMNSERCWI